MIFRIFPPKIEEYVVKLGSRFKIEKIKPTEAISPSSTSEFSHQICEDEDDDDQDQDRGVVRLEDFEPMPEMTREKAAFWEDKFRKKYPGNPMEMMCTKT